MWKIFHTSEPTADEVNKILEKYESVDIDK
jgi:hypothetical protein